MSVRKQLKACTEEEQKYLMAKLCAISEEVPKNLGDTVDGSSLSEKNQTKLNRLCGEINNIVIVLLRMEQMQKILPNMLTV